MALLHFDGFDLGDFKALYSSTSGQGWDVSTTTRYGAGRSMRVVGDVASVAYALPAPVATIYTGFAYYVDRSSGTALVSLHGDGGATEHIRLWWSNTSTLNAGRAGTVVGTAAVNEPIGSWLYVEVMGTVAATGGRIVVKIDGTTVIDFTGNTKNGGTASTIDTVRWGGSNSTSTIKLVDDFYVCDGTGPAPHNTFLGPVRVYTLSPNGPGVDAAMTPSTGANWECVADQPYTTSKYVTGSTGQRDTYAMADLPGSVGTIFAVQPTVVANKTDAGALNIKTATRSGGNLYTGSPIALGASDGSIRTIRTTDPATSAPWTATAVNALEAGVEVA